MRIIAGSWRGRALAALPKNTSHIRPTGDRVRENLFNILNNHIQHWPAVRVLDVCAGSGALGFEALSRGAAQCTFIEKEHTALEVIANNKAKLGNLACMQIVAADATCLPQAREAATLALIDPPYALAAETAILTQLKTKGWLAPGALISLEMPRGREVTAPDFDVVDTRNYGKTQLCLLRFIKTLPVHHG
jgi:16S rRNA (guanine966-N2)-methyltransferase